MNLSIILPTFNEAENMRLIIPKISEVLQAEKIGFEIIVVDDNSPDGTAAVAMEFADTYSVRTHVRRNERGLATAVMKGFDLSRGEIVLVMDADMSHPVEMLPAMVRPIMDGRCDATVGSRYTNGGGCADWPFIRRVISKGAGVLAKGVTDLTDPTSGFMAIRKDRLNGVGLDPVGWKIVLEVMVKARPSVREIPISFSDRVKGESKLSWNTQVDYIRHLIRLYVHEYGNLIKFAKFCLVGFSGMIVDTAVLVAFVELMKLDPRIAAVFAFMSAVTWNFKWNQRWTFPSSNYSKTLFQRYYSFITICVIGLGIRIGIMHILLRNTAMGEGRGYITASILGILSATIFNFFGSKLIAFRHEEA